MSTAPAPLANVWRGDLLESQHVGHAVVVDETGDVVAAWGDPKAIIYPRSSSKMLQALPLVESGAARDLTPAHLALACASHQGAAEHVNLARSWLSDLGLDDDALRCGPEPSREQDHHDAMIRNGEAVCQVHNNCSGKHSGFLTLGKHLQAGPEYIDPDHPVQIAVREAFEDMTGETSPTFGIDGCSAPNFATSVGGLALAMAKMARLTSADGARGTAAETLRNAMMSRPDMVAGRGRACTRLMEAAPGQLAVKTGAEGVFVAILPDQKLGIALKTLDGATRAAEAAITALAVRFGALEAAHPVAQELMAQPIRNRRDIVTGYTRVAEGLLGAAPDP